MRFIMEKRKGEAKHWEQQTEERKVHKGSSTQLGSQGAAAAGGAATRVRKTFFPVSLEGGLLGKL